MTRPPEFDELIGAEVPARERERLERVHDLLVAAGPPPELSPELEAGPDMLVTYRKRPHKGPRPRRMLLLAAALVVVIGAFLGGYLSANRSSSDDDFAAARQIKLHSTGTAPEAAFASIGIGARDEAGNWPMKLVADGLPPLPRHGYYEVFLTRKGKIVAPCGSFKVRSGSAVAYLNAPYRLGKAAGWVVTTQHRGDRAPGPVVLST
jgi:hypothetical protein